MRQRLRRGGIAAAVAVVVLVGLLRVLGPPPTTSVPTADGGTLVIGERARGTYQVGGHTVVLTTVSLIASHPRSVAEVWRSSPGRAFVAAARGAADITGRQGMLRISDRWDQRFTEQTVDGADLDEQGQLVISGQLTDPDTDQRVAYQLFIAPGPTSGLEFRLRVLGDVDRVTLIAGRDLDERVMGLGAQFTDADLRGRAYPIISREQGVGRGAQPVSLLVDLFSGGAGSADTTPAPLPFYVTSVPRSLWLTGPAVSVIDLRGATTTAITVWDESLTAVVAIGSTPAAHVSAHARATGLMRALPEWSQTGVIAGLQGGDTAVRRGVQALQDAGVPVVAVAIGDWADANGLAVDAERYPGWQDLIGALDGEGIRVLTRATPELPVGTPLHTEASESGFLLAGADGEAHVHDGGGGEVGLVDLLAPAAREWFAGVLADRVLGAGASGFEADLGPGVPLDGRSASAQGLALHAEYPAAWAATTAQALDLAGLAEEGLVWHRAAGPGSAADATMFWAGDQLVDFSTTDGLSSALGGILSGGLSGMALQHFDIGGHTTLTLPGVLPDLTRSAELHQRSAELAAFTPLMRTDPGNRPDLGAQAADPEVAAHLAQMADLFAALVPERTRLSPAATVRGLPLVRHPVLVVPEQPEVTDQPRVFFLGEDLFVAPVLRAGQRTQTVRLPVGEWQHVWTGEVAAITRSGGGLVTVDAPIGRPPAWARVGSSVAEDLVRWRDG
ncbi:alpha-glucosidase [soil metagenome]